MVRPIDLQDNLSKAPLASRLQQIQQDAEERAHLQVARDTAQQQIVDRSRTLPADEAQRPEVHPEGSDQQRHGQGGSKRQKHTPEEASAPAADEDRDPHHIDIVA